MGGKKTRRHFAVEDRLPEDVRAQVDRLLIESATYDEVAAFLAELGYDISRSAIGRYGKEFLAVYQRLRMIEDQSRALVSEAGEGLVLEEAAAKLFAQQIVEGLANKEIDVKRLPRLVSDFAKLQSSAVQRERFKKDIAKKTVAAVEKIEKRSSAGGASLSPETLRIIKEEVYGIV